MGRTEIESDRGEFISGVTGGEIKWSREQVVFWFIAPSRSSGVQLQGPGVVVEDVNECLDHCVRKNKVTGNTG